MNTALPRVAGGGRALLVAAPPHGALRVHDAARVNGAVDRIAVHPAQGPVVQACTTTLAFVLSTLAAWREGRRVIMPSTRLDAELRGLVRRFDAAGVLDDRSIDAAALLAAATPAWPPPALDGRAAGVVLFTSGTTREPVAHDKSLGMLLRGADSFTAAFPVLSAPPLLVATVDCHHMFGLEAALMACLGGGHALCVERPTLPADFADLALRLAPLARPLWLVTTPLQLSALHRAPGSALRGVERVIVATMPVDRALARAVERDWRTRVDEIYGNTECGVIGTRRPAVESRFTVAPGMVLRAQGEAIGARRGPDAEARLDDRLELDAPGRSFAWAGRQADMVKVAGKRTSLPALDARLRAIDGVDDGAFVVLPGAEARVAALAVAPTRSPAELRKALAATIDSAFMPRPLVLVDRLPRDARGKLPRAAWLPLVTAAWLPFEATRMFAPARGFFAGHFPGMPIAPAAALLAEAELALARHGLRVLRCDSAKFLAAVTPGDACAMRFQRHAEGIAFTLAVGDRICVRGMLQCEPAPAGEAGPAVVAG